MRTVVRIDLTPEDVVKALRDSNTIPISLDQSVFATAGDVAFETPSQEWQRGQTVTLRLEYVE